MKIATDTATNIGASSTIAKTAKLVDAAQEFEASMLQELLKPMQNSQSSWGGEDTGEDNSFDTIRSFGSESVAKAMAKGGGFGIAREVLSQISLQSQRNSQNSPAQD